MRTKNSIKNIFTALIGQIFGILISFVSRLIFIKYLGIEYLGINGLFTNILTILSLAELGVGSAMIYSLYKPIAEEDKKKIQGLMNFYATAYNVIGIVVLILGVSILPFLNFFVKTDVKNLELLYFLYLASSVITYFYAYKRSLIIADQKNYIVTFYRYLFVFLLNFVQILILVFTRNFILFLIAQIIFSLFENIAISRRANQLYPNYLQKNRVKIDSVSKNEITKNIRAMFFHRIGGVIVDGTSSIFISLYSGVLMVGLYSNYLLIINALNSVTNQMFSSITASVGNLNVKEGRDKSKKVYDMILLGNFWIFGFISICLWILINPFISLWLGEQYILNNTIVLLIIISFYFRGMRKATLTFKDAYGLFWNDRYKPVFEAVLFIIFSLILGSKFGITGILLANILSSLATNFWIEPYVLFKFGFKKNLKNYYLTYMKYTLILIVSLLITSYFGSFIHYINLLNFVLLLIICIFVPNLLFFLLFRKTNEFQQLQKIINMILFKFKKHKAIN